MLRFLLLALLIFPLAAQAAEEVRGIQVETKGRAGADAREAAVNLATQQAAAAVWKKMGHKEELAQLTPEQLQGIATYVDVKDENIQTNYYSATFNIGIDRAALVKAAGPSVAQDDLAITGPALSPIAPAPKMEAVESSPTDWVLVVPAHSIADKVSLWNSQDPWSVAWMRAPSSPNLFTAAAGGDEEDKSILPSSTLSTSVDYGNALLRLAEKYKAPAVVLVTLRSAGKTIKAGEEITLAIEYYSTMTGGPITSEGTIYVSEAGLKDIQAEAVTEAQRLISDIVTNNRPTLATAEPEETSPTFSPTPQVGVGYNRTGGPLASPSPPMASGYQKLWVRMPLKGPGDLATYRSQIESIPEARFEILALTKAYVEANIVYKGDQAALMQQLSAKGLKAQN